MKYFIFLIILFSFTSSHKEKPFMIHEYGFRKIKLGRTKRNKILRKYPFAEKQEIWKHYKMVSGHSFIAFEEVIKIREGIELFFWYKKDNNEPITVYEIIFSSPLNAITDKGIILGKSTFQEVNQKYGMENTFSYHRMSFFDRKKRMVKMYDNIEFYSDKMIGKDSIEANYIVTHIKIIEPAL